jgi:tetratricopeptide (TPR) repeat protein
VLELAADAARWAGEPERGLALAETAIAELDAVDDAERMALMLRRRAGLRQELLLSGQLDDLHAALRLASAPSLVRAQVLARLCWALKREDRYAESEQMAVDLRTLAGQLGDEEHRVEADMALASLGALRGEDTMAALRGAQEAAQRAGFGLLEAWAYLAITNALEGGGRHELAIPVGREGLARAIQLGLGRQIAAPIAGNLAESLTSAGRWDEAVEILDEVLGLDRPGSAAAGGVCATARRERRVSGREPGRRGRPARPRGRSGRPSGRAPSDRADQLAGPAGPRRPAGAASAARRGRAVRAYRARTRSAALGGRRPGQP